MLVSIVSCVLRLLVFSKCTTFMFDLSESRDVDSHWIVVSARECGRRYGAVIL